VSADIQAIATSVPLIQATLNLTHSLKKKKKIHEIININIG